MDKIETAFGAPPGVLDESRKPVTTERLQFTPGDFLRQVGLTVAICLGLALLAQMLLAMIGES